ncbi:ribosome small subunit-dependent GTPase A [Imhoffiella purpurea]|uniref:Small ribosomal subunit biogenesis GTPase RsgA n=1 Tax=Imhoffiella purpurea TaxID=1249627 RepID=W9V1Y3_9GAMM|nr:ribosome small subunit-dependent GTPase A [Imhoffiella purpurea]EXJ13503.1 Putative GTPase [Imhoffiella purpurea]
MTIQHSELAALGWTQWFEQRVDCDTSHTIARVAAVDRDRLLLLDGTGSFRAKLAGGLLHRHRFPHDLPCVGDWVCLERQPGDDFAIVHSVVERRTALRRKSAGNAVEYQMIAANLDTVMIVQSCHFDFNLKRLERYLVMVMDGGADPCVLLTKTDLVDPDVLADQLSEIEAMGLMPPVLTLSNVTQDGLSALKGFLAPGKTYCFVGSSGVGKSTLINHLIDRDALETGGVSATGEGRHTTVRRELIRLGGGALVVDTPGMREFGILDAGNGIESRYAEITELASRCRYRDCTHSGEPGCAVREAVDSGEIGRAHFENYLKLRQESEFNQMTHAERRKKDRDFGRFIKSVKKDLKTDR